MSASQRKIHAAELRQLRAALGLNQDEMGKLLGVTREWVGKLEREKEDFSEFVLMKMDAARAGPGGTASREPSSHYVIEPMRMPSIPYGPAEQAAELREMLEELIVRAASDPNRLGWLLEQMRAHLVIPAQHWRPSQAPSSATPGPRRELTAEHEAAIRREQTFEHSREERAEQKRAHEERSSKTQSGAGR